jgi:hypothetical protein
MEICVEKHTCSKTPNGALTLLSLLQLQPSAFRLSRAAHSQLLLSTSTLLPRLPTRVPRALQPPSSSSSAGSQSCIDAAPPSPPPILPHTTPSHCISPMPQVLPPLHLPQRLPPAAPTAPLAPLPPPLSTASTTASSTEHSQHHCLH